MHDYHINASKIKGKSMLRVSRIATGFTFWLRCDINRFTQF